MKKTILFGTAAIIALAMSEKSKLNNSKLNKSKSAKPTILA